MKGEGKGKAERGKREGTYRGREGEGAKEGGGH